MSSITQQNTIAISQKVRDDFRIPNKKVYNFLKSELSFVSPASFKWSRDLSLHQFEGKPNDYEVLVELSNVNRRKRINKYFERVNQNLEDGKYYVVPVETNKIRRVRILRQYPKVIKYFVYLFDFFLHRVLPKLKLTQNFYFSKRRRVNRALSLTEVLGRLQSSGFEVIGHKRLGYQTYIISKKVHEPHYDTNPTYGPLCTLKRVGKDGKLIEVYKLRTMHPYSEYLQQYLYEMNGTSDGDKIIDDFRVTSWGRVFRKFWIDELPMLYNYFKGDLKLVGVRPLSKHKFETYPKWLQEKRTKVKPGLIPPYYVDLPESVEEFYETESNYLDSYFEHPYLTDIKYFFKAMHNILFKKARSK